MIIFDSTVNLVIFLDLLLILLLQQTVSLGGDPFVGNTALIAFALSPAAMVSLAIAGIYLCFVNIVALGGRGCI